MTYDQSRDADLKQLYEARQNANHAQREEIDKIRYKIMRASEDEDIVEKRQELVQAVRNKDSRHTRKVSEEIKVMGYRKGLNNG